MPRPKWPTWWEWELELSPHLLKRMTERRITEIDLRSMLDAATSIRRDAEPGRWVIGTVHRRRAWSVILEPDPHARVVVVVTAFQVD